MLVPGDAPEAVDCSSIEGVHRSGFRSGATLRGRLSQYKKFCAGEPVGHWGGRFICQLADLHQLLVAWRPSTGAVQTEDSALILDFKSQYGQYPFANLRS